MELAGKTAVVTGAARGIGEAAAHALARAGARVVVADIADGSHVAEQINAQGGQAVSLRTDVADFASVQNLMQETIRAFGSLDILVANAAFSLRGPFFRQPMEEARRTVDVTMWGVYHSLRAFTEVLVERSSEGSVVVIGSPHALEPVPECMAYNMAKAAVDQMARTAAAELFRHRIRVNIVHPGWTDTPGERRFFTEEELAEQAKRLPAGRLGRPEEVARAILFLVSPASEYINGSTYTVDGGLSLPF